MCGLSREEEGRQGGKPILLSTKKFLLGFGSGPRRQVLKRRFKISFLVLVVVIGGGASSSTLCLHSSCRGGH